MNIKLKSAIFVLTLATLLTFFQVARAGTATFGVSYDDDPCPADFTVSVPDTVSPGDAVQISGSVSMPTSGSQGPCQLGGAVMNYSYSGGSGSISLSTSGTNSMSGTEIITAPSAPGTYTITITANYDSNHGGPVFTGGSVDFAVVGPTTVTVNSCPQGGSWSLSPAPDSGNGTNSMVVSPSVSGTSYTLNYTAPSGYTLGSISPASSQLMYPGNAYSYTATCQAIPQPVTPPTNPVGSCNVNNIQGTFSWTPPAGYTTFHTGALDTTTGIALAAPTADDNFVGTSKTFNAYLGHSYQWWVQTKDTANGTYSTAVGGNFTCACPANQHLSGTACVWDACTNPDQTRDSGGSCTCPVGKVANGGNTACVYPACPTDQTRDANGVCQWNACPTDKTRDANGVCQWNACPNQQTRDANGVCQWDNCPVQQTRDAGGTCQWDACPNQQTRDSGGVCQWDACPAEQTRDAGGTCQWNACPTGKTRDSGGVCQQIVCPTGQHLEVNSCVPDNCPASVTTNIACLPGYTGTHTKTTSYAGYPCKASVVEEDLCKSVGCPDASTQDIGCPAGYSGIHKRTTTYSGMSCTALVQDINTCTPNACGVGYNTTYGCPNGYVGAHNSTRTYINPPACTPSDVETNTCTPGTIPIAVSTNMPATWIVNPGNIAGRDSRTVNPTPGVNGTLYTLTPQALEGYDYPPQITNNKTGAGSSMLLVAGEQGAFSVTYIRSFDYTLTNNGVSPSPIIKGGTGHNSYGSVTITKTKNSGAADAVNLSVSGVPAGVTIDMPGGGNCAPNPTCDNIINFTVSSNAAVGTHPITVTGTASTAPGQKTTTFNLVIDKSPDIVISSCSGSPNPAVLGQQAVTWTASGISGGTGTGYTFTWTGSGIPTSPAPTTNPYTVTYTTTGAKVATFHVLDSNGNAGTCTPAPVQVNFDPNSREI